jgi:hypothetical protein
MPKPIATTDELKEALSALCYEVGRAKDHHGLLNRLIETDKGRFEMAMSLSPVREPAPPTATACVSAAVATVLGGERGQILLARPCKRTHPPPGETVTRV